jgi:hypothetical protein
VANIIPAGSASIPAGKAIFAGRLIGGTPTQTEPLNIGFGQGSPAGTRITALVTDLGLSGEVVANGGQTTRIAGASSQVTTTNNNDTYQVVGTITANVALALVEVGLFDTNPWPAETTVATQGVLSGTGTGTFTITSASGFPTIATNYQIESEIITGTLSGTTLTITARGVNGSTAVAHAAGAFITVVSAGGTGGGGKMAAKGDFAVINLATTNTLQNTATVQFT